MRAHIHILFSVAFVLFFNLLVEMNLEVNLILAALFSLLPDIDEPNSISGRLFAPVSKRIHEKYGHRTITHSLVVWLLISLPFFASSALAPGIAYYLWGIPLGYLSHIFADLLTVSGIPLAYPWSKKKFVALGGIVDTGKRSHTIITTVFISAAVLLLFQFSQSGWLHSSYGDVKDFWNLNENYLVGVDLQGSWRDTGLPVEMQGIVIKGDGDLVYFLAGSKIYSYSTVLGNQRSSIYSGKAELLKLRPASTYLFTLKPQNGNLDYESYRKINIITNYLSAKYMKKLNIKQFDEKEQEIADALISLGVGRNAAIALAYLRDKNSAKSRDFERAAGLRQPEVSLGIRELMEREWVTDKEEKKPGKGRPYKVYSLKIGFDEIVAQLETQNKKAVDEAQEKIERLRELRK